MENRHGSPASSPDGGTLSGLPRIHSGLDFVQRWEANVLLNGLIGGSRAHRILLEVVRRIANDRPPDMQAAFDRLQELQAFLNAMDHPITGAPAIDARDLVLCFEHAKHAVMHTEPWHGPARYRGPKASRIHPPRAIARCAVEHSR